MLSSLRNKILIAGAALFMFALPAAIAMPATVSAGSPDIQQNLACGTTELSLSGGSNCKSQLGSGTTQVNTLIERIINIFSIVVGIIAVIMIIVGGFKYITSGGDSGNISSAKTTIIYAVIGLVIVALAQFIVQFVLDKATN